MSRIEEIVAEVNGWPGRPTGSPLLYVAKCRFCGHEWPSLAQDHKLAQANRKRPVCGAAECRRRKSQEDSARRRKPRS